MNEWQQCLVVCLLFLDVWHLDIECYRGNVKDIFFLQVAVLLQHMKKVVLFGEQLMVLDVVHHLARV